MASRRIVLVGAGHTNLHIVRMWMQQPIPNAQLVLISPFGNATYSGMLPGTLAGLYEPSEMEIDLYRLTRAAGVQLIVDEVIGLEPRAKAIRFRERPSMMYDIVSVGVGSLLKQMDSLTSHPGFVSIKPMHTALRRMDEAIQREPHKPIRTVIVGGGAAGVEVAFCVEQRIRSLGRVPSVKLCDANSTILRGFRTRTVRLAERELERRGISIQCGCRITGHEGINLLQEGGGRTPADVVIWVTGASPPPILGNINLPKAESGFLRVTTTLQSVGDPSVFVVGDSAEMDNESIDRAGVYAVRQGPILWTNLNRLSSGQPLEKYHPQRDFLRLLATGDGKAIGQWKWVSGIGAHWWKLKNRIDSNFMNMFRPSSAMMATQESSGGMKSPHTTIAGAAGSNPMRCRGCGGKTSARVLQNVLHRLREEFPSAPPGFLQSDDTALLPKQSRADAVSVDFFPAFIDDPWLTGRIAAIHSLSDLWASGVKPTAAVAMITLPEGSVNAQTETLYHVLSGAIRELNLAGAVLVGGHTTNGDELAVGFTVFGQTEHGQDTSTHEGLPLSKGQLRPGQQLILTKPLGVGVILAANDQWKGDARAMSAALATMLQSNQAAMKIATEADVDAATDVTGFGLAGHLQEMCLQSSVSVELDASAVRLIPGAAELLRNGVQSSLAEENEASVENSLVVQNMPQTPDDSAWPLYKVLFDPQTSGGLLIGVDGGCSDALLRQLVASEYPAAAIIGRVIEPNDTPEIMIQYGGTR